MKIVAVSSIETGKTVLFRITMTREVIEILAIASCLLILITIELKVVSPSLQDATLLSRLVGYRPDYSILIDESGNNDIPVKTIPETKSVDLENSTFPRFTVIIVTFNEPLLYKTFIILMSSYD